MVPFEELDLLEDEYDDEGSYSGSTVTCAFHFCFDKSVGRVGESIGRVNSVGSRMFVPTGIKSIGDVFLLVAFVSNGVECKSG